MITNFNLYEEKNNVVQEAYALLTANIHFNSNIKTVTITSCIPGAGKTTIGINLAMLMAKAGRNTLFVDADLRKPGKTKRITDENVYGISDVVDGAMKFDSVLVDTNIPKLYYISCGKYNHSPLETFCSSQFQEFVDLAKQRFDFVIFDTPALSSVIDAALLASKTDATLLIAEIGKTTLTSLKLTIDQMDKANANILGVVMNKAKKRDFRKYVEDYDYFSNSKKFNRKHHSNKSKKYIASSGTSSQ